MVRFSVVGVNHNHIYGMTDMLLQAGAELATFCAPEQELASEFARRYPQARHVQRVGEVLEDTTVQLVATAGIPAERGPLGIEVMRHGKDFLSDKPAFTTLELLYQAERVQRESRCIYAMRGRAIGQPLQTVGLGPHRLNAATRGQPGARRAARAGGLRRRRPGGQRWQRLLPGGLVYA